MPNLYNGKFWHARISWTPRVANLLAHVTRLVSRLCKSIGHTLDLGFCLLFIRNCQSCLAWRPWLIPSKPLNETPPLECQDGGSLTTCSWGTPHRLGRGPLGPLPLCLLWILVPIHLQIPLLWCWGSGLLTASGTSTHWSAKPKWGISDSSCVHPLGAYEFFGAFPSPPLFACSSKANGIFCRILSMPIGWCRIGTKCQLSSHLIIVLPACILQELVAPRTNCESLNLEVFQGYHREFFG